MTKRRRRVLIWVGSIFGIVAIALAVFIATLDQNKAKKYISAGVSKATGRQLSINGDLKLDLGWISRLSVSQIQFQNAGWSKHPQMAEVGLFDVEIDLWQLVRHFRVVLPTVTISQPKVVLEKNAEGSANWEFRAAPAVTAPVVPENRSDFPVIEKLIIKDGMLLFDDQESSKEPYPLQINFGAGKLKAKIDGNLTEPLAMKGEDVTLDIQGDDMANLYPLIRLVFPSTPPYRLKGRLKHEGKVWSFANFSGRVGDSDLSGNIRVDTAPKRPFMKADLISNLLDFDDLAG